MDSKKTYQNDLEQARKMHRAGAGGIQVALTLTLYLDKLLKSVFQKLQSEKQHLAIVALGGYGRKELCFSSDTDVMFLIADEQQRQSATLAVQEMLHKLMDFGLSVGHSFRTIEECLLIPEDDFESQISLMETRFICGNVNTYNILAENIQKKIKESNRELFVKRISDSRIIRYQKYGNSSKLLEPNIKNSAGGLRDIHSAFWLLRGTASVKTPKELKSKETALLNFLQSKTIKKQFTASFIKDTKFAFDTLLRVRNEMHLQSKSLHDTLEFGFQRQVASQLRYRLKSKRTKVERFMQNYYTASRSIALFCSRVVEWANDNWSADSCKTALIIRSGNFIIRNKRISLSKKRAQLTNTLILQALLLRSEHRAEFSFEFEDAIHRRLQFLKPLRSQIETDLFRLLLHRPNGVGSSVRKINELGLLEKWMPEWKPMVSFFQHNQYHYYTADEHTLITLINAEELEKSNSTFGQVFRSLPRRDTLYLACLMHDIAKPQHIGKHEIRGIRIAKRILRRLHYDDIVDDIAFLVRHHLLMEQVAFRRNLNDPQTIIDFAHTFQRIEQLDYLYVLTYADLSAVNKNVLTEWKELLLWDLYRKARIVLEEEMTSEEFRERNSQQIESHKAVVFRSLVPEFPPEEVREHLELFQDSSYLSTFNSDEIENHLRIIRRKESVTAIFQKFNNYSDVTFIARDAPGVLSKLCGVLTANDVNILDAQIFTRRDGIIIDKFRTVEFVSHNSLSEEICQKISRDVKEVIHGKLDIAHLIERHRMKWKRRAKPLNPNIRCDVEFEEHPHFTIIDIYAPDMLGFLYRITEKISQLGLNITFAKIATRVDGIVDTFYLLNNEGNKLNETEKQNLRFEIIAAIKNLCDSQLVVSS